MTPPKHGYRHKRRAENCDFTSRRSPNCVYVGDQIKVGEWTFRCVQAYPEAFYELVDQQGAEDCEGVPEPYGKGAL